MIIIQAIQSNFLKAAMALLLLSFNFNSIAQNQLEKTNTLKLNFSAIGYQPMKFKSFGYNNLRCVVTPTFQVGFGYNRVLKKNWSLDVGLQYSLMGFRTRWYELTQPYVNEEFIYPRILENTTYLDHRLSIETGISKLLDIKNGYFLQLSYMPTINIFILDSDYLDESILFDSSGVILGESYFSMVRPNVSAFDISLSHSFKLGILKDKKKSMYSINLVYNLAPKVLGFGTYKLDTPDFKGGGVLYKKSSYFGIEYNAYFKLKKSKNNKK